MILTIALLIAYLVIVVSPVFILLDSSWVFVQPIDAKLCFGIFAGIGSVLLLIARLIFRDVPRMCCWSLSVAALSFSYGALAQALLGLRGPSGIGLSRLDISPGEMVLFVGALSLCIALIFILHRSSDTLVKGLGLVLIAIAVLLGGAIIPQFIASRSQQGSGLLKMPRIEDIYSFSPNTTQRKPNIVHIVLGGYANSGNMKRIFNEEATDLKRYFEVAGFYTPQVGLANYPEGLSSMASLMNLRYLDRNSFETDAFGMHTYIRNSSFVHKLQQLGYRTEVVTGSVAMEFEGAQLKNSYRVNEVLAQVSVFFSLPWLRKGLAQYWHQLHRQQIDYTFDELERFQPASEPRYVLGHIASPRPPFVFNRGGETVEVDRPFSFADGSHYGKRDKVYIKKYVEQYSYITARLTNTLDQVKRNCNDTCIIVVHSDHGSGLKWESTLAASDMEERYSVPIAIYFPGGDKDNLPKRLSLVNVLRIVLNRAFNQTMSLVPDQFYSPDLSETSYGR